MSDPPAEEGTRIYTIGHSNHAIERVVRLLQQHGIALVVDVRSRPYSRYVPQFNQEALRESLAHAGIGYAFRGQQLGGRPPEPEFYDETGRVRYDRLAETPAFRAAIEELIRTAGETRLALMCSEEDPRLCHRWLLISRTLVERGAEVLHIRADGRLQADREVGIAAEDPVQPALFQVEGERPWRSIRSVSPGKPPPSSSKP